MKIEKIIETIKIAAAEVEWNYPLDYTIALNEAAELLEKQVPKEPFPKTIVNPFSLSMLVWHSTDEEVPTEEKQYLCRVFYNDKSYFKVLWWSNDISKVDKFGCKGQGGFYEWHPEIGYHEAFCDYWQEINWNER